MVPVSYLPQTVVAHKSAFVHISVHAVYVSFTGILPYYEVLVVVEDRFLSRLLGYHELVVAEFAAQVSVVEVCAGVEQWFLFVGILHHVEEFEQRVAEGFR